MICNIELFTDDNLTRFFFAQKLEVLSASGIQWKLWDFTLDGGGSNTPDLSLVDASRLELCQLAAMINKCHGRDIALWGREKTMFGFPLLPKCFLENDLAQVMPVTFSGRHCLDSMRTVGSNARRSEPTTFRMPIAA